MKKKRELLFESTTTGSNKWPWTSACPKDHYHSRGEWPVISVVIPSYNQGAFLEKTIRSVLMQNYPSLELIVIDGGSTDMSVEIIEKYAGHLDFWVSEEDSGQANAINKGLQRATGDILYWINSDDYLLPKALFHVGSFDWKPEIGAIVGIGHKVDLQDRVQYTPKVPALSFHAFLHWVGYGNFMQPACFFSAKAWEECGPLNEKLDFCLDVDLWLKISQKYKFVKIEQDLAHAYIHPTAKTTAERERSKAETALLIATYQGGFEAARQFLYKDADQLSSLKKLARHPLIKAVRKIISR
ncbi:MAG: glycosyltransferase family 2 protein [Bacteroidota bacterium]